MTCTIFSCVARIVSKKDFAIELMCVLGPKCSCVIHTEQVYIYIHSSTGKKKCTEEYIIFNSLSTINLSLCGDFACHHQRA
jgi:hypothetical protein